MFDSFDCSLLVLTIMCLQLLQWLIEFIIFFIRDFSASFLGLGMVMSYYYKQDGVL